MQLWRYEVNATAVNMQVPFAKYSGDPLVFQKHTARILNSCRSKLSLRFIQFIQVNSASLHSSQIDRNRIPDNFIHSQIKRFLRKNGFIIETSIFFFCRVYFSVFFTIYKLGTFFFTQLTLHCT